MKKTKKALKTKPEAEAPKKRGPKAEPLPDISHLTRKNAALLLDCVESTVLSWVGDGMPQLEDGYYDGLKILKWRFDQLRDADKDLETKKLRLQCEKMELDITDMKAKNIPLTLHEEIMTSRMQALKNYWKETFARNVYKLANKNIDQLRPIAEGLVRDALNHYCRTAP